MSSQRFFHFTIGPVQAFVAQARRTRDFWAGSFLLSTLSAVAMLEVRKQGGKVRFPRPDPNFLSSLEGEPKGEPPQQGLIPNRFKAKVQEGFDPAAVCRAVRLAWVAIARLAWKRLPGDLRRDSEPMRTVWSRQIGIDLENGEPLGSDPFWEMAWALGSEEDGEDLLDRRKNLRTAAPLAEPGVKCMLMDGWQELSGVERPGREVGEFWTQVREHVNQRNRSDLREDEQLCAISVVKRLFPHDFHLLSQPMPSGWTLRGWRLGTWAPSAPYLAAAPWLAQLLRAVPEETARDFRAAALKVGGDGEKRTRLRFVRRAGAGRREAARLADLDGDLFFDPSLASLREPSDRKAVAALRRSLAELRELPHPAPREEGETLGEPDPYFAVLAMDGDDLGKHMADRDRQDEISQALADFTSGVPAIVEEASGFLIYAGGDDVMALLPVPSALGCARELRAWYRESFRETSVASTLSGAVLLANHKLPLTHVLHDVQALLKHVAKDGRGRDAIAVQVTSRGGELIRWAQPWEIALEGDLLTLERLAAQMAEGEAPFSHRFFHRIDALLRLVNPDHRRGTDPLDDATAADLFTAELLDSSRYRDVEAGGAATLEEAEEAASRLERAGGHVRALLRQCRPQKRRRNGTTVFEPKERLEADGAFLVRFLSRRTGRVPA